MKKQLCFMGNLFKMNQISHFFGALRANIGIFEIHDTNFTTGSLSFLCKIGNSYRFVKFWPKKGLEFLDLLSFFSLSFCKSGKKKPESGVSLHERECNHQHYVPDKALER